jgi:sigma-B regulation protein RsbU (phosphoserine phosphatase)
MGQRGGTGVTEPLFSTARAPAGTAPDRYASLGRRPETALGRLAAAAARLCRTEGAAVVLADGDGIRFAALAGPGPSPTGGAAAGGGAGAALAADPDLADAVRNRREPWMLSCPTPGSGFCAGVPLFAPGGDHVGALCVLDRSPRPLDGETTANLEALAAVAVDVLELRRETRRTVDRAEALRREAEELAAALQASLLPPKPPHLPEMELAARYQAGESGLMVGGDFYDVFRLASNDWGIVLGDVCGKGARPASLATLARWAVRAAATHQFSPSEVLQEVNTVFAGDERTGDDRYCSAVFARLELDTCGAWLTVANAGHPRPILVRRSGKVEARSAATVPVGLFDRIDPHDDRVGLGPGDSLVFYTDGITEARNPAGELFGEERLQVELAALVGAPADVVADRVVAAAAEFAAGTVDDDVAVLVVRVPDDAGRDPLGRLSAATGLDRDRLELPGYPKDTGPVPPRPTAR